MAAYRRVYDSRHLQADCQEPGSAPEPYAWATFCIIVIIIIATARIVSGSRVYASVRPSVVLSQHWPQHQTPQQQTLLLWARPAGYIDRLLYGAQQRGVRQANADSATLSACVRS